MNVKLNNRDGEIVIKGRVGQQARFNAENSVTNLSFAVSRSWPSKDNEGQFESRTQWYEAAVWGRTAESMATLDAGDIVEVSYHASDLRSDVWRNQDGTPKIGEDGDVRSVLKIDRCYVRVLEKKAAAESAPEPAEVML